MVYGFNPVDILYPRQVFEPKTYITTKIINTYNYITYNSLTY